LNKISTILFGEPYFHPGSVKFQSKVKQPPTEANSDSVIILSLETLGSFDFSDHMLFDLVRKCSILYLDHANPFIRREAALSVSTLLAKDDIIVQASNHAMQITSDILERLLDVGVTDPELEIRECVLAFLDDRFDRHLSQSCHIVTLFKAFNDETFSIREKAVVILCRLIPLNPAYILPQLRKSLILLLTELEFSSVASQRNDSASLLGHLVPRLGRMIMPYIDPIVEGISLFSYDEKCCYPKHEIRIPESPVVFWNY
jgi:FKBP12-rapamycin complex-associated protein